jgi:hypothetical protein
MKTTRNTDVETVLAPAEWGTGTVYMEPVAAPSPFGSGAAVMRFAPYVAFLDMQEADASGSPVTWGESVTDEQYAAAGLS